MIAITASYVESAFAVHRWAVCATTGGIGVSVGSWVSTGSACATSAFRRSSGVGLAYGDVTVEPPPLSGHPSIVSDEESGSPDGVWPVSIAVGRPPATSQ